MGRRVWIAVLALSCGGWGCSSAGEDGVESAQGAATEATLRSAYALLLESHVEMTYPSSGSERFSYDTRLVARVLATRDADGVVLGVKPCALALPPVSGFQPTVPEASFAQVPDVSFRATLTGDKIKSTPSALMLGVRRLDDPLRTPLPRDGADTIHVFDQDRDGAPGFSIHVAGGRVFVGIRIVAALDGTVGRSGEISGSADGAVDSEIYGDSILFVDVKEQADSAEKGTVVAKRNRFRMVPMAGAPTCAAASEAFAQ